MAFWHRKPPLYRGRLFSADGNLFAQDGRFAGHEVKHVPGVGYAWVNRKKGDTGHFQDHHRNYMELVRTDSAGDHPHHFAATPDDAHYDSGAPGNTRLLTDPDAVAPYVTGHTDAYTKKELPVVTLKREWVTPELPPAPPPPVLGFTDTKQPNES